MGCDCSMASTLDEDLLLRSPERSLPPTPSVRSNDIEDEDKWSPLTHTVRYETCDSKRPQPLESHEPMGMDAEENQAKAIKELFEEVLTQQSSTP